MNKFNFDSGLYTTPWISADTDVWGEISDSALSAAVEFQVDALGAFTSKKSAVSEFAFIYLQSASQSTFCPRLDVFPILSTTSTTKYSFG